MLKTIKITICQDCLDGKGQECHTPGCALWLHSVDLPIDERLYEVVAEAASQQSDSSDLANAPRKVDIKQAVLANIRKHADGQRPPSG